MTDGITVTVGAIENVRRTLLTALIDNGSSQTPLYVAAQEGKLDCVKRLIWAGADVNKKEEVCHPFSSSLVLAIIPQIPDNSFFSSNQDEVRRGLQDGALALFSWNLTNWHSPLGHLRTKQWVCGGSSQNVEAENNSLHCADCAPHCN